MQGLQTRRQTATSIQPASALLCGSRCQIYIVCRHHCQLCWVWWSYAWNRIGRPAYCTRPAEDHRSSEQPQRAQWTQSTPAQTSSSNLHLHEMPGKQTRDWRTDRVILVGLSSPARMLGCPFCHLHSQQQLLRLQAVSETPILHPKSTQKQRSPEGICCWLVATKPVEQSQVSGNTAMYPD